jgi:hypothetical protein
MKASEIGLRQLVEGFELSCRAEGKSPRTIEWYVQFLRHFCSYFEKADCRKRLTR